MKRKFKRIKQIVAVFLFIYPLFCCKDFLTIDLPKDQLVNANVFTDEQSAKAALFGIYGDGLSQNPLGGTWEIALALSADELQTQSTDANYMQFQTNEVLTDNSQLDGIWNALYNVIYQANSILEGIAGSSGLKGQVRDQISGEAYFMRAYAHFLLLNAWGDIPLILTTNYQVNQAFPKEQKSKVYRQVLDDLQHAYQLISDEYQGDERVRPNKAAVAALLARVYLYLNDWESAAAYATEVIKNPAYELSDIESTFLKESKETVWQLMSVSRSNNTVITAQLVPSSTSSVPTMTLRRGLVQLFEGNDRRFTSWVGRNIAQGEEYFYAYKYKVKTAATKQEYLIVFRLAELYLIRAEALVHLQKLGDAEKDLNVIRHRANISDVHATSEDQLLTLVSEERQRELFLEGGHRWFDLKRTGNVDKIMAEVNEGWEPYKQLWPIPYNQLMANPFLAQNDGY